MNLQMHFDLKCARFLNIKNIWWFRCKCTQFLLTFQICTRIWI